MLSSERVRQVAFATSGAILLAIAFPRVGWWWCAPIGAAALFSAWEGSSWRRAFALGWLAGWIFFTISFWWWSTTIATAVGGLAYVAVVVSAAIEALAIGFAGALGALARARSIPALAPLGTALAFAVMEWLRSIGPLGVPFAQLGYTQADSPLRIFAAYVGTNGVTLVICILAAYFAAALAQRTWKTCAIAVSAVGLALALAWFAWPARTVAKPIVRVAAVQGDIAQSLKWEPGALQTAIDRYDTMTAQALASHPQLIVWPETVIAIMHAGLNQSPGLLAHYSELAHRANATIVVGSIDVHANRYYNALYFFTPQGLSSIYDKHQLVPFAEHFPGQAFLYWLPYIGELNGGFSEGSGRAVYPTSAGLTVGPLICWESAFGDIAFDEVREGAQVLVVSTDDAWFGTSSGPYQHAQIAQLRAVEAGAYVVRAAATGISGIIAPDGTWQARVPLDMQGIADGSVGPPVGSIFSRIGPNMVWFAMTVLFLAIVVPRRRV